MKISKVILWVTSLLMVALIVAGLYERRIDRLTAQWQRQREDEAWKRAHIPSDVPVYYLSRRWRERYGADEPDTNTSEGLARKTNEENRLFVARNEFRRMLNALPSAFVLADDSGVDDFLARVKLLLDGFSFHELRGSLLYDVKWELNGLDKLSSSLSAVSNEHEAEVAVRRCYRVRCALADLLWTRCGDEYAAAQSDYRCYRMLKECRNAFEKQGWLTAVMAVESLVEQWKRERCDSPDSNFRRSHEYCEEMYKICFEERVKRGEGDVLKMWQDHYRFHLSVARSILKREPKWSPDYMPSSME